MEDRYLFKAKHIHILPGNDHLDGSWVVGFLSGERYIANDSGEYLIDPSTICQCAGYEGIYEKDIFQCDDERYVIEWCDYSLCWEAQAIGSSESISLGEFRPDEIVVIGNIFDNPELLESEEYEWKD